MLQPRSPPKPPEARTRKQRRTTEAELAALVGDFIESPFKREAGLKDSGHFCPGSAALDLLDNLLFNAPIMYVYLRHVWTNQIKAS
jgi:predicted CDP-diglyceride synthetase/phosphatidate cytidylyltransferase